jgi:hypothetical protein
MRSLELFKEFLFNRYISDIMIFSADLDFILTV